MSDPHRYERNKSVNDPAGRTETTRTTETRTGSSPATIYVVAGLVVAVALIAFLVFGNTGTDEVANVDTPAVENNVTEQVTPDTGTTGDTETTTGEATPPAGDTDTTTTGDAGTTTGDTGTTTGDTAATEPPANTDTSTN